MHLYMWRPSAAEIDPGENSLVRHALKSKMNCEWHDWFLENMCLSSTSSSTAIESVIHSSIWMKLFLLEEYICMSIYVNLGEARIK